jgi:tetraacyldisaccharide 4'-kinase
MTLHVAHALERGSWRGPLARASAVAWSLVAQRAVVRRLVLPKGAVVVAIGGATLGGSGKTPLAMACAAALATGGARVAFVGHAYRASPRRARTVRPDDALREVGDEAILAARTLAPAGVRVCVGRSRAEAIALAASQADILVLDGVAQTTPVRASLALLAVDARDPWGSGAIVPLGDLRAPRDVLEAACDAVVAIGDERDWDGVASSRTRGGALAPTWGAHVESAGARVAGALLKWDDLAGMRVGLLAALARVDRVVRGLERRGIALRAIARGVDHGPLGGAFFERARRLEATGGVDLWLTTPKCAVHLARCHVGGPLRAPIGIIDHTLKLGDELSARLNRLRAGRPLLPGAGAGAPIASCAP